MWLLSLLAVLTALTVAGSAVIYLLSGDRRYLQLAWRLFRYAVVVTLLVFAAMILERVAIIPV
ncbi:MAG TPA: hypothetical protein PLF25_02730 [Accumulibacter sp.]|nr:hypothetical protein [Accumulibacter sp.]